MSISYVLRRAFGFDHEASEEEEYQPTFAPVTVAQTATEPTATATEPTAPAHPSSPDVPHPAQATAPEISAEPAAPYRPAEQSFIEAVPEVDPLLPGCIFDSVIRLFNRTMPEFVSRCLDTDAQRQYLFHSIDSDLRRQLVNLAARAARRPAEDAMAEESERARELRRTRATAHRRIEALESRVADLEKMLIEANEANSRLAEENNSLKYKLRRSRSRHPEQAELPSLFQDDSL